MRGFKFHPTVQGFDPSDEAALPAVRGDPGRSARPRSSTPGRPASAPGCPAATAFASGCPTRCCSTRSPRTSPTCRSSWPTPRCPWQDEALSVATHKHNTWIDLSGWSPKYFPAELVRYANSILKKRVLFGSDFPLLTPDRWIRDVEQTALKPEVMPGIMKDNAARLLGLAPDSERPSIRRSTMTTTVAYADVAGSRRHRPRLHRLARDHPGARRHVRRRHRRPPVDPRRSRNARRTARSAARSRTGSSRCRSPSPSGPSCSTSTAWARRSTTGSTRCASSRRSRSGARVSMTAVIAEVAEIAGGYQFAVDQTIEIEGGTKPAVVARGLYRFYA